MTAKEARVLTEDRIRNVDYILTLARTAIDNHAFAININDLTISDEQQQTLRELGYSFEIGKYGRKFMSWKNAV